MSWPSLIGTVLLLACYFRFYNFYTETTIALGHKTLPRISQVIYDIGATSFHDPRVDASWYAGLSPFWILCWVVVLIAARERDKWLNRPSLYFFLSTV